MRERIYSKICLYVEWLVDSFPTYLQRIWKVWVIYSMKLIAKSNARDPLKHLEIFLSRRQVRVVYMYLGLRFTVLQRHLYENSDLKFVLSESWCLTDLLFQPDLVHASTCFPLRKHSYWEQCWAFDISGLKAVPTGWKNCILTCNRISNSSNVCCLPIHKSRNCLVENIILQSKTWFPALNQSVLKLSTATEITLQNPRC